MAHGVNPMVKREIEIGNKPLNVSRHKVTTTKMGSRRIFTPQFKLQVLDSYRHDSDCKGNQRATARKYGIHRRQIQKWLQGELNLRSSVVVKCQENDKSVIQIQNCNQQQSNAEVFHLSLDITRQSVAATSNKSNTGFLSPVHSHAIDYTTFSYEHISPSVSLPTSPVFTAPIQQPLYEYSNGHFIDYSQQMQHQSSTSVPLSVPPSVPSSSLPPSVPSSSQHFVQQFQNSALFDYDPFEGMSPIATPMVTPIDLSVNNRSRQSEVYKSRTPSPRACVWQNEESKPSVSQQTNTVTDLVELTNVCYEAIDLSFHKRKATDDNYCTRGRTDGRYDWESKPVKLFKPYLDNNTDDEKKCKSEQKDPIIWSNYCENYTRYSSSPHYDTNNNIKESMYSYPSPSYPGYVYSSFGSPVSGYDSASSTYSTSSESSDTKKSFDCTIDFKFQPIDNYYGDMVCRGDEKTLTDKYYVDFVRTMLLLGLKFGNVKLLTTICGRGPLEEK